MKSAVTATRAAAAMPGPAAVAPAVFTEPAVPVVVSGVVPVVVPDVVPEESPVVVPDVDPDVAPDVVGGTGISSVASTLTIVGEPAEAAAVAT
jgi:hypothetical protein